MNIVYIHGAGSSPDTFNFIREHVKAPNEVLLAYDCENGFRQNLDAMAERIDGMEDLFFIAHSLGGVYALHLASRLAGQVRGGVTMATPYGGSRSAVMLSMIAPCQLYRDIQPHSDAMNFVRTAQAPDGWTALVSTKGRTTFMSGANDGVVTSDSMYSLKGASFVEVEATHHEIVQSWKSIEAIKAALAVQRKTAPALG